MTRDLVVVGTGPAGLSAGLLAGRYGLDAALVEREDLGGGLVDAHGIEDYPGFPGGVSGAELRSSVVEQLRAYDLDLELAAVTAVEPGDPIRVETDDGGHETRAVVVASGGSRRWPDCPGAERFEGRGVFSCAGCDGPLYRDERVAVLGGGEQALLDALYLAEFAAEVLVLVPEAEPSASAHVRERVADADGVTVRCETALAAVLGDDVVTGVEVVDAASGGTDREAVGGLLVQDGLDPNVGFLPAAVETTDGGAVVVDAGLRTSVPGVFAAGVVREHAPGLVAAAVGDGATAFHSARAYLD